MYNHKLIHFNISGTNRANLIRLARRRARTCYAPAFAIYYSHVERKWHATSDYHEVVDAHGLPFTGVVVFAYCQPEDSYEKAAAKFQVLPQVALNIFNSEDDFQDKLADIAFIF